MFNNSVNASVPGVQFIDENGVWQGVEGGTGLVLTSNGEGVEPSYQAPAASGISTINGDSGSITGSTVTISAGNGNNVSGSTVSFVSSGDTSQLHLSDGLNNVIIGASAGNASITSADSTGMGVGALAAIGGFGGHTAIGRSALQTLGNGQNNCAFGYNAFSTMENGSSNIGIGYNVGSNYTTSEGSNILIGSPGVSGESNVMRLGTQGTGAGQVEYAFIAGVTDIDSANFTAPRAVFIDGINGQLGITTASPTISITGDSGGALTSASFTLTGGGSGLDFEGSGSTLTVLGVLNVDSGGTGNTDFDAHSILIGTGTDPIRGVATTGNQYQVLMSGGSAADPLYSAAVYPWTTSANEIMYSSSDNTLGGIAPTANGVLISSDTNVPSFLPNGLTGEVFTATTGAPPSWQPAVNATVPAFSAYLANDLSNTTGNGDGYVIPFDTTLLNVGSCYDTTNGAFTAPVSGNYLFTYGLTAGTADTYTGGSTTNYLSISGVPNYLTPGSILTNNQCSANGAVVVPLVATDTVIVIIQYNTGTGVKDVSLVGDVNKYNYFTGTLI